MDKIKAAKLPGFYTDERGACGIILGAVYICCSVNLEDGQYDVTADGVDENGDFARNYDWQSFDDPGEAIARLRFLVKHYAKMMKCA